MGYPYIIPMNYTSSKVDTPDIIQVPCNILDKRFTKKF